METLKLENKGLFKLKDLKNYKIAKPDFDVRGWNVFSSDKKSIGRIDDILVNPELKKICYLDIYLHNDIKIKNGSRHLFVPFNMIKLDLKNEWVNLLNIKTITSLRKIEDGEKEEINQPEMINQHDFPQFIDDNIYNNNLFDESNFHKSKEKKLYKLKELNDSKIFENFPYILGWCVITSDHINIGQIDELFVDKEFNKVRYLDVKIYEGPIFDIERHILVPVGLAELGVNNDNKVMIKIDSNNFVNYPPYNGESIGDYEKALINYSFNNNDDLSYT